MKSTHTRLISNLPDISRSYKTVQIYPSNNNISLIALGKLYDNGYKAKINNKVYKVDKKIKLY